MSSLIEARSVSAAYGEVRVLQDVSVAVAQGSITTVIGSNGVGKTTLMRVLAGLLQPKAGDVVFRNDRVTGIPAHKRVDLGVSLVPEGRLVFPDMTVQDTLRVGAFSSRARRDWEARRDDVYDMFPRLKLRRQSAGGGSLSGGEQQMLATGRALMARLELLLLDESSLGLSPIMADEIMERLISIRKQGTSICLVEQNVYSALSISDYAYVLESGCIAMEGPSPELIGQDSIRESYLGM